MTPRDAAVLRRAWKAFARGDVAAATVEDALAAAGLVEPP